MPKVPMDYSKCSIYKIEHVDDESLVYVGHTTNFDKRKTQHKINCYNDNGKPYNFKVYQMIRENGGWEKFLMLEVEKYPCNDRREAERRENEVMKELKSSMNTNKSFLTQDELTEYKKEYNKEYNESNKHKIQEYMKDYYELHKPEIKEQVKDYYKANKLKLNAKVKCECGCEIVKQNLKQHQASKKHFYKLKNI